MSKFILRLIFFTVILIVLVFPLVYFKIGGDDLKYIDNPIAGLIDKHKRMASQTSPRLIIMGGSNAFYGMNSAKLSDSLHMNVVNMALFGGLGLDFMLNQLKGSVKKNDVVVLSIEYFLFPECYSTEDIVRYYPADKQYLENYKAAFYEPWLNVFKVNIESVQNFVLTPVKMNSSIYVHSRMINKYGDAVGYLNYEKPPFPPAEKLEYRYYEGIERLNKFNAWAKGIGAKVYFTFPPLPVSDYTINLAVIDHYYADLKKDLKIQLLCAPAEMIFSDDLFYDSHYHLDKVGREIRTKRLIKMLMRANT